MALCFYVGLQPVSFFTGNVTVSEAAAQRDNPNRPMSSLSSQTISFSNPGSQQTTNVVVLDAFATSGLPVTFTVTSGPAIVNDGTILTFTGAGTVTITATQAGDATWAAATPISQIFTVSRASATVTLINLTQAYKGTPRSVTATTVPAGLTVDITYNGSTTVPVNAGSYSINAVVNDPTYQGNAQ